MKRSGFIFCLLLVMGLFYACSSSEEVSSDVLQPGDQITLYGDGSHEIKAVYMPISYQDAPGWIKRIIDEKDKYWSVHLFQGERTSETLYFFQATYDSSIGEFLNKEGESLQIGEKSYMEYFSETSNWKLILYY